MQKMNFWTYIIENVPLHLRFGKSLSVDELISFYPNFEEPLFSMNTNMHFFVEKIYKWIIKLITTDNSVVQSEDKNLQNIVSLCLDKEKILTNELFLILIKLLRKNPNEDQLRKTWIVLAEICSCLLPSNDFLPYIYNYFYSFINNHPQQDQKEWARLCLKRLYSLEKNKFKRNYPPSHV